MMLVFAALVSSAFAVPQSIVWAPGAQDLAVSIGDVVTFSWAGTHNVYELADSTTYASCDFTGSQLLADTASGGSFVWTPTEAGEYFFACSLPTHCAAGFKAHVTVNAGNTYIVQLGGLSEPDSHGIADWYANAFYPQALTISAGDTVRFVSTYFHSASFVVDPTSINFFTPAFGGNIKTAGNEVHSGVLGIGQTFDMHFPDPGVFPYFCTVHPEMFASITVLAAGETLPAESSYTQADIDAWVATDLATTGALEILHGYVYASAGVTTNSDGTRTHSIRTGDMFDSIRPGLMVDWLRFAPGVVNMTTGDTLRVYFSTDFHGIAVSNTSLSLDPLFNWFVLPPTPSRTVYKPSVDPNQLIMSPVTFVPDSYEIVFGEPGSFRLYCYVHTIYAGMWADIHVSDPAEPITCPPCDGVGTTINFNFAKMFGCGSACPGV
eukprot:TRINITY_DN2387_c0_g1_i1.p1 TRINITY_DN2387_c0_g1~~TRINITY_DN2387_c0_g1_i1.p1  ORF type:complete len:436 (+),score=100.77 TRINITY_DN2387_c0_g1_i1:3-1310(+)